MKPHGPQIDRRIRRSEQFLRSMAAKLRNRAEAHNLARTRPADYAAGAALRELSAACDRAAGNLREPELPLEKS